MMKLFGIKPYVDQLKGITRDVRVGWILEELELSYEYIILDAQKGEAKTAEYLKLNPTGKVPTLVDGDFSIFESAAICSYLAHKSKKLLPAFESPAYWIHQQWIFYVLTNIEPHAGRVLASDYFFEQDEKTAFARKLASDALGRMLAPLDERLKKSKFIMGEDFMVADLILATCLMYVRHSDILQNFSNLQKYLKDCEARPAHVNALKRVL